MKIRDFYTKNDILNETLICEDNAYFLDVHHYPSEEFKQQIYDHMKYPLKYILTVEEILSESAIAQKKNIENGLLFVNHVYSNTNGTTAGLTESNKLNQNTGTLIGWKSHFFMYWHLIKKRPTSLEIFKAVFGYYRDEYYKFF